MEVHFKYRPWCLCAAFQTCVHLLCKNNLFGFLVSDKCNFAASCMHGGLPKKAFASQVLWWANFRTIFLQALSCSCMGNEYMALTLYDKEYITSLWSLPRFSMQSKIHPKMVLLIQLHHGHHCGQYKIVYLVTDQLDAEIEAPSDYVRITCGALHQYYIPN